ncbi:hypothetical protein FNF29_06355 [Cafeteria roenbergensis]|uniref:AAA+ ATPase domain-containing protein n=1 Tax=Cafeteria roenbergensis TaxID=33653 RepID=A0A5A8CAJ9_CAFRO|nr:hypothetical protein FNF29_06355 [Cafeteria roenbergensis]|eukprot:KAA0148881.1 hypothetical protein FNF29_06355 [Cafeteria roenbergensis]
MAVPGQVARVPTTVEVCIADASMASPDEIRARVSRMVLAAPEVRPGPVSMVGDPFLAAHCRGIRVCEFDDGVRAVPSGAAALQFITYQLSDEGPAVEEVGEGEDAVVAAQHWQLPAAEFEGLWESLVLDPVIKRKLLRYAATSVLFSDAGVDPTLVSLNRLILLHGPPGTGKTTLCKALAHKLALRMAGRYPCAAVLEVNSHSLFSRWFSESGKLVGKLFDHINDLVADEDSLVIVLIDEVESLSGARQAAMAGAEPSDSVRVVNALLTQLDALRARPNVLILATSNITEAIDAAFVDRADLKIHIGPPSAAARFDILSSCVVELERAGIVVGNSGADGAMAAGAAPAQGLSSDRGVSSSSSASGPPESPAVSLSASRAGLTGSGVRPTRSAAASSRAGAAPGRSEASRALPPFGDVRAAIGEDAWSAAAAAAAAGSGVVPWTLSSAPAGAGPKNTSSLEHSDAALRAEATTLLTALTHSAVAARLPKAAAMLAAAAGHSCGLSGRALRKVPFTAHASHTAGHVCTLDAFCEAVLAAVRDEADARHSMSCA